MKPIQGGNPIDAPNELQIGTREYRLLGYDNGMDEFHYVNWAKGSHAYIAFVDPDEMEVVNGVYTQFKYSGNIEETLEDHVNRYEWRLLRTEALEVEDAKISDQQTGNHDVDLPDSEDLEDTTFDDFA